MPYIKKEKRQELDILIKNLSEHLSINDPGSINYVISKLLYYSFGIEENYKNYNTIMGILSCVEKEFYRRLVSNYEDIKISENGDVF